MSWPPSYDQGTSAEPHPSSNDTTQSVPPRNPWWDGMNVDFVYEVENLELVQTPWTEDHAFWPTTITYSLAFLVGIIGNCLVVFALLANRKARNVTSSFLVSLAISDIIFLLLCVPYETVSRFTGVWAGGLALCKISGFVEMLSAVASILNLTAVSMERYVVIVHPLKARSWCTMGNTKKLIAGVWVVAITLSSPTLYIMNTTVSIYYNSKTYVVKETCSDTNVGKAERILFAWYQLIIMFVLPMSVMVYCYAYVIHVLWASTRNLANMTRSERSYEEESRMELTNQSGRHFHAGSNTGSNRTATRKPARDHSSEIREARKQVIKMLLTIIGIFLFCWGPKLILNIMKRHTLAYILHKDAAFWIMLAIHLLPYIQSCANPIIYSIMSKNFQHSLRNACRTYCHCRTHCSQLVRLHSSDYDTDVKSCNGNTTHTSCIRYSSSTTTANNGRTTASMMTEY